MKEPASGGSLLLAELDALARWRISKLKRAGVRRARIAVTADTVVVVLFEGALEVGAGTGFIDSGRILNAMTTALSEALRATG